MKVKIWGARGSQPAPHTPAELEARITRAMEGFLDAGLKDKSQIAEYLKKLGPGRVGGYGGNTTCIEVSSGNSTVFVDGGSGIRMAGYDLLKGPCGKGQGEVHIYMTHFHWDHVVGLPFFTPIFIKGNTIHFHAVHPELEEIIRSVFKKPYFPVDYNMLGAKIVYHRLEPRKKIQIGQVGLTPYQLDHPDPCWGARFEADGKAYAHCVDSESTRFSRQDLGADLPLYQNADLMLFDAQYTLMETIERVNWGHGSSNLGIDIAMREKVKKILFFHHDPASSDEKIAAIEDQTRRYYEGQVKSLTRSGGEVHKIEWLFVREGMVFDL